MTAAPFILGALLGAILAAGGASVLILRRARRTREAERRARNAERLAEIGAMTGGLAHEIKNPLSSIALNAQLLSEAFSELPIEPEDRDRLSRRIGSLRREVDRLRDILADFLQFAGAVHLDRRPTDLNDVVSELAEFFMPQAEQANVRLRLDLAHEPINASADAPLLKQALLNLVLNATQVMTAQPASDGRPAAELILRTERRKTPAGPEAAIHVIDTGPGIPPDRLPRIFEPYFTTRPGGSGLGLPTSRRLVEEHGGRIDVHSEPGKGSDFTIRIPLDPEQ
ncbi:MAG: PAS domain-containing sensor histidine kinase [Phycisphaerales bacterium]